MNTRASTKAKPPFTATSIEEVFGSMGYEGSALTLDQMDAAVRARAKRHRRV